jgi:hypothetical protein
MTDIRVAIIEDHDLIRAGLAIVDGECRDRRYAVSHCWHD